MNRLASQLSSRRTRPLIFGMIHLQALPGTPMNRLRIPDITSKALEEAEIYKKYKLDGIIVENMHDVPYVLSKSIGPEVTATMSSICHDLRKSMPDEMPIGVQILAGCNKEALAVALASDLDFIRAECYVYSHIADEGLMNGSAGDLMRYRAAVGADHISVITDIKKKHSAHVLTSDITIEQTARDAEFFLSNGVIVTGNSTGMSASTDELKRVKEAVSIPVFVGSGVTADNMSQYASADGLIIGSYLKRGGHWRSEIDAERVCDVIRARDTLV